MRSMQCLQTFQYARMPTDEQECPMRRFAGLRRFVFNPALAFLNVHDEKGEKKLGDVGLSKELTSWRNGPDTPWLSDALIHPLPLALKDLERADASCFPRHADFPRFQKRGRCDSFRYPDPKQIQLDQGNNRLFLPRLGWLRYRSSRDVLRTVKTVTVSQSCGQWFVSIQTERAVEQPIPNGDAVGIDLGEARFATLSDGPFDAPSNSFKRHPDGMHKAQQAMSRKVKFSNHWRKEESRIRKIHASIGNARRDDLYRTSTPIIQTHAIVGIENLEVMNLSTSSSGSTRPLDGKLAWAGDCRLAVPPQNTSRNCPCCGQVSADHRQTHERFDGVGCGFEENADQAGAIHVLRGGHTRLAGEVSDAIRLRAAGTHRSGSGVTPCRA